MHDLLKPCPERRKMEAITVPSTDEWLSSASALFSYTKSFQESRWDPFVVLHTNGSTGTPKPVIARHDSAAISDGFQALPEYQGTRYFYSERAKRSSRMFLPMPMFHAAGILCLVACVYCGLPTALPLTDRPLSANAVLDCLGNTGVDSAMPPPAIVEGLAVTEDGIRAIVKLSFLSFGGGELTSKNGRILC